MEYSDLPPISPIYNIKVTQYRCDLRNKLLIPGLGQISALFPILVEIWDEHRNYGMATIDNLYNSIYDNFGTAVTFESLRADVIPYWMARVKTISPKPLLEHVSILHSMKHFNPFAVSGIEMALWDLIGRRSYLSIPALMWMVFFEISKTYLQYTDLDEMVKRVKNGVHLKMPIGFYEDLNDYKELIDNAVDFGIRNVKLHILPDLSSTAKLLDFVKNNYPDMKIETDANGSFNRMNNHLNFNDIVQFYQELERFNCQMHEQPLRVELGQEENIRKLMRSIETPIGFDEGIQSLSDVKWIAKMVAEEKKKVFINLNIHRLGGITEAIKIINYVDQFNRDFPHCAIELLTSGILDQEPSAMVSTAFNSLPFEFKEADLIPRSLYFANSIFKRKIKYKHGKAFCYESEPGHSISVDKEKLATLIVREFDFRKNDNL